MKDNANEPITATAYAAWDQLAQIETDRFCDHCGYNMRQQIVRREPTTQIPVCRCPECGRFHSVASSGKTIRGLIDKLSYLWAFLYLGVTALLLLGMLFGQWLLQVVALELARTYMRVGYRPNQFGGTHYWYVGTVSETIAKYPQEYLITSLASVFGTFVLGVLIAAHHFHWQRGRLFRMCVIVPLLAFLLGYWFAVSEFYDALANSRLHLLFQFVLQLIGLLAGIVWGRSIARRAIRSILPTRLQPGVAYLWLADGLDPPMYEGGSAERAASATMARS